MIDRWRALDAIPRARRTAAERAEWERLDILREQQIRRLPGQIAAARARLARHESRARALGLRA